MQRGFAAAARCSVTAVMLLGAARTAAAATPGEVSGVMVGASSQITWSPTPGADDYNVYRGLLSWLPSGIGAKCHGDEIAPTNFTSLGDPPVGQGYFYWVTAESSVDGEGTVGVASTGGARPLSGRCDRVMRHHVLDRIGFGENEWTRARIASLGIQGYIDEQLNPASIDETTNTELKNRVTPFLPPASLQELQAIDIVAAVYARHQLEEQVTLFWDNHFNTNYAESSNFFAFYETLFPATRSRESAKLHYDAQGVFRDRAFNGTFREMLQASGLGPAMIIYLDTVSNIASAPNENYAREVLELHTMGVDGGYTQQDVVQLAKVFTGWNVCKKTAVNAPDPLSPCIPKNFYGAVDEPAGVWVSNFRPGLHDTTQKILFSGTPYRVTIPSTAGNAPAGVNDALLAYDAIVAHPSTPRFIATKLLRRFVDENPTPAMIDSVVAAWNNPANPHGTGDLREVLRAVLAQAAFRDPDHIGGKIKTPFEHIVSAFRAVRGKTDGLTSVRAYLGLMQELFHNNPVPTGYSEIGSSWVDTNNILQRQNFGLDMTSRTDPGFGADVIGLLHANGVATASAPNHAAAIVDFLSEVQFGGALTPAERQRAIDYLNTNDSGVTSAYNDARIRETAGFLLGYPQFLEQ